MTVFIEDVGVGDGIGMFLTSVLVLGLTMVPAIITMVIAAADPEPTAPTLGVVCVAGLLAGAAVPLPYLVRLLTGWPSQTMATTFAVAIAVAAIVASIPLASWHAVRRIPRRQQP